MRQRNQLAKLITATLLFNGARNSGIRRSLVGKLHRSIDQCFVSFHTAFPRLDDVLQDVEFCSAYTSDGKPLHRSFSMPWKKWRLSSAIHPIRGQGVLVSQHYPGKALALTQFSPEGDCYVCVKRLLNQGEQTLPCG
jgi:hypothetical protein